MTQRSPGVGVTGLVDEMEERAGDQIGVCLTFERLNQCSEEKVFAADET